MFGFGFVSSVRGLGFRIQAGRNNSFRIEGSGSVEPPMSLEAVGSSVFGFRSVTILPFPFLGCRGWGS